MKIFEELKKTIYSSKESKLEIGKKDSYSTSTPDVLIPREGEIIAGNSYAYNFGGQLEYILAERDQLINQWRNMSFMPEVDQAIQEIINEALVFEENDSIPIELDLEDIELTDKIKEQIVESFHNILNLLNFRERGDSLFRQWYIDGVLNCEVVYNNNKLQEGIKRIILLSPYNFFKIKYPESGKTVYFMTTRMLDNNPVNLFQLAEESEIQYEDEQITQINSGLLSYDRLFSMSHLNKAMKVANQVSLIEDSIIIHRITRAPEKKVFYIDTGRLPKAKAEQHIQNMMNKHRNKLNYNIETGTVENQKKTISILEDYWLGRCITFDTKIKLLDGRNLTLEEIIKEYEEGKVLWTYSIDRETKEILPGLISWAGETRKDAELYEIELENGEKLRVTPDHKMILNDGTLKEAQYLTEEDELLDL